jgi:hypothetical protein
MLVICIIVETRRESVCGGGPFSMRHPAVDPFLAGEKDLIPFATGRHSQRVSITLTTTSEAQTSTTAHALTPLSITMSQSASTAPSSKAELDKKKQKSGRAAEQGTGRAG